MQKLNRSIITACLFGILISTYALYVEMYSELDPDYAAFCDLGEYASCTRVLTSDAAKGFGLIEDLSEIPNCIVGTMFFCVVIFLTTFNHLFVVRLQFLMCLSGVASSIYLAYLLTFVLKDFCIVCVSTYIINFALAFLTFRKLKAVHRSEVSSEKKVN